LESSPYLMLSLETAELNAAWNLLLV
jgi:hypothetical protein